MIASAPSGIRRCRRNSAAKVLMPAGSPSDESESGQACSMRIAEDNSATTSEGPDEFLRLQEISTLLIQEGNLGALYERVLDAAIGLMSADMGSMQTFYSEEGELRLLAWRGFR